MVSLFIDLSINPGEGEEERLLKTLYRLGYRAAGAPAPAIERLEPLARNLGLRLVPRIHVVASTPRDLSKASGGGLLVVEPTSLEAARRAAVMRSVALIRVRPGMQRIVDKSTARLFRSRGGGAIEISLKPLLSGRSSVWRWFTVSLRRALAYGLDVVLVSDASSLWELWHPRVVEGLASLAGVPQRVPLSWLSNTPRSIIESSGVAVG